MLARLQQLEDELAAAQIKVGPHTLISNGHHVLADR